LGERENSFKKKKNYNECGLFLYKYLKPLENCTVTVNVIKVSEKPCVVIMNENGRIMELQSPSKNADVLKTGFIMPTHDKLADDNFYAKVSVSHKRIKV
jgi:hypothetical protein